MREWKTKWIIDQLKSYAVDRAEVIETLGPDAHKEDLLDVLDYEDCHLTVPGVIYYDENEGGSVILLPSKFQDYTMTVMGKTGFTPWDKRRFATPGEVYDFFYYLHWEAEEYLAGRFIQNWAGMKKVWRGFVINCGFKQHSNNY